MHAAPRQGGSILEHQDRSVPSGLAANLWRRCQAPDAMGSVRRFLMRLGLLGDRTPVSEPSTPEPGGVNRLEPRRNEAVRGEWGGEPSAARERSKPGPSAR